MVKGRASKTKMEAVFAQAPSRVISVITPHAQRERSKVIDRVVSIYYVPRFLWIYAIYRLRCAI